MAQRHIYLFNDSYPELRNIPRGWARHKVWWRALKSAFATRAMWIFMAKSIIMGLAVSFVIFAINDRFIQKETTHLIVLAIGYIMGLSIWSWFIITTGGDMVRPHLRRTTPLCGESCVSCGYHLKAHIEQNESTIRCPECGSVNNRSAFREPFTVFD